MAVILGAMMGGQVVAAMPDAKEGAVAAARIRRLIGDDGLGGEIPKGCVRARIRLNRAHVVFQRPCTAVDLGWRS
jgi:hypothetical protein